ncbi:hypothetical protein S83_035463 [Arachis hypogaea]
MCWRELKESLLQFFFRCPIFKWILPWKDQISSRLSIQTTWNQFVLKDGVLCVGYHVKHSEKCPRVMS